VELYPRLLAATLLPVAAAAVVFALYIGALPPDQTARQALPPALAWAIACGGAIALILASYVRRRDRHRIEDLTGRVDALRHGTAKESMELHGTLGSLYVAIRRLHDEAQERRGALEMERERMARILDRMAEGVLLVDAVGRVAFANPACQQLFGRPAQTGGRSVGEVTGSHRTQLAVSRAATTGEVQHGQLTLPGPPRRALQLTAVPVPSGAGTGVVMVFNDVTELQRAIEVRRDFVANASHELKTPVSAIKGAAETLQNGALLDREAARRFVDNIRRNAERLAHLTEDLLSLSRLEAHALPLQREPVDLAAVIHDLCTTLRQSFVAAHLELRCHVPEGLPAWHGNRRALEQVLTNLMDNARSYTPAGGEVNVGVTVTANVFAIHVRDTGIGIEAHHLPRLFERFYRVDAARSRAAGGTGLGLSLVKHLTESLGGKIDVDSTPGNGSTFTVQLPGAFDE
jgi:two-component system phosphate regulon sensor histidine kinase PhoR